MNYHFTLGGEAFTITENIFDRAIRFFDPILAHKRLESRVRLGLFNAVAGGYTGASQSRRSLSSWNPAPLAADADVLYDLRILRARSRDLVRNEPIATGAVNTTVTNVIGPGLRLQCRIDREILKMSDAEADVWETKTEREFTMWSGSKDCDAARTQNFAGLQDLVFRSTLESGDALTMLLHIERPNNPYALALQIVEADRLVNQHFAAEGTMLLNGHIVAGGVEQDAAGAPIAYHILNQHPGAVFGNINWTWTIVPAFGAKTGRRNVLHHFKKLRPGQTRGVPFLAPVMESLKQLGRYTEAELMAAVISGFFTVFVKTQLDLPGGFNPMSPITETGATTNDDNVKLANGAIVSLAPGEDISTANPGRPNTAFDPFVQAIARQIGVGLEIPYEVLIKHFTASYSAARAALLEAWKFFNGRRAWVAADFCQPVYEAWMDEAVARGRITAPGYFKDPLMRAAYLGSKWIGPAKGQINERDEVVAATLRVDARLSTLDEETAQLNGGDFEDNIRQMSKEQRMLQEKGLGQVQVTSSGTIPRGASPEPSEIAPGQPRKDGAPEQGDKEKA